MKLKTIRTGILLAAAMFLAAGVPKLLGAPVMVQMFNAIGIGQWFRYLTGSIEVLAGLAKHLVKAALGGLRG